MVGPRFTNLTNRTATGSVFDPNYKDLRSFLVIPRESPFSALDDFGY